MGSQQANPGRAFRYQSGATDGDGPISGIGPVPGFWFGDGYLRHFKRNETPALARHRQSQNFNLNDSNKLKLEESQFKLPAMKKCNDGWINADFLCKIDEEPPCLFNKLSFMHLCIIFHIMINFTI
nr:hypothetical protein [Comamonas koreensis]